VFKIQFCNVLCSHKDEQSASKSLEQEVILSWKSLENHSQNSVRTLSILFLGTRCSLYVPVILPTGWMWSGMLSSLV